MTSLRYFLLGFLLTGVLQAQNPNLNYNKFKQLHDELPTPNVYRTASGAPGHDYYQQQADYVIAVELDEAKQVLSGTEVVTYHNNSPDALEYLWMQLDQNVHAMDSDDYSANPDEVREKMTLKRLYYIDPDFDGGFKIESVADAGGKALPYIINRTMMRIDLPTPLAPGKSLSFSVKWHYNIHDRIALGGRTGFEYFPEEDNYLFVLGMFYPRMAVYNEVEGWQHLQYLGRGEFALPFGNFDVKVTVPADHVVAATGVLQNPEEVLTQLQRDRLKAAATASQPVMVIAEGEARKAEKRRSTETKTWHFKAENVRDFAWTSSRKYIWDAWGVPIGDRTVMAMSLYPKEGNPLWEQYSTKTIAHSLKFYSEYLFDYPYPVAWSVNADNLGMEFPMISFNWGRPEADGTYTEQWKYFTIAVIIHEIGHNYFPMIINSDERQWAWMDEGLNCMVQFLAEQHFEKDFPSRRGEPYKALAALMTDKSEMMPLMTTPESIHDRNIGDNAYVRATTALNILRETILGRELFDHAMKVYANRWKFKHPTPADFFRTMEDASGTDLDWFWRGWFYSTDHVDIAIDKVRWFRMNTHNPEIEKELDRAAEEDKTINITDMRNDTAILRTYVEEDPSLADFYTTYDPHAVTPLDQLEYAEYIGRLTEEERAVIDEAKNYYEISFSNIGGLVMPLILEFELSNGTTELRRIPAEIWRYDDNTHVKKVFAFDAELVSVALDPYRETADTDLDNNYWPPRVLPTRFELYLQRKSNKKNPMQLERDMERLLD